MSWPNSRRRLCLTAALSIALFSTGCAGDAARRLGAAAAEKARAGLVDQALDADRLPDLPADCRRREASGVAEGDRLDAALLKATRALGRQNARGTRCAAFYDEVRAARGGAPSE
jgi:hypothetical protein